MLTPDQIRNLVGTTAQDRSGDRIGKIGHFFFDDNTDQPKWVTVNTGLFGMNESFVPLQGADVRDGTLVLAYDKGQVKNAPNVSAESHLSVEEEQQLYRYYDLDYGTGPATRTGYGPAGGDVGTGHTTTTGGGEFAYSGGQQAGPGREGTPGDRMREETRDRATDDAMTRSEERLSVDTETRETGRARLRKHVVTEHQQVDVPVSREEVRVEREPITEENRGAAVEGPAISEREHEVTLREERPVVDKEAVPVERVRLGTETVRDTETVGGEVRREEIEVDDPGTGRRRDRD